MSVGALHERVSPCRRVFGKSSAGLDFGPRALLSAERDTPPAGTDVLPDEEGSLTGTRALLSSTMVDELWWMPAVGAHAGGCGVFGMSTAVFDFGPRALLSAVPASSPPAGSTGCERHACGADWIR